MTNRIVRIVWQWLGLVFVGAGIIGIFVPLLPTTPFLLLAVFCFERGSPRLHNWLISHPTFGPAINNWRAHGAISNRSKLLAITFMALAFIGSWYAGAGNWVLMLQGAIFLGVGTFLLTRPHPPN